MDLIGLIADSIGLIADSTDSTIGSKKSSLTFKSESVHGWIGSRSNRSSLIFKTLGPSQLGYPLLILFDKTCLLSLIE